MVTGSDGKGCREDGVVWWPISITLYSTLSINCESRIQNPHLNYLDSQQIVTCRKYLPLKPTDIWCIFAYHSFPSLYFFESSTRHDQITTFFWRIRHSLPVSNKVSLNSVPHLLWYRTSVYMFTSELGPMTLTPVAKRLTVELSLPVLTTWAYRGQEHRTPNFPHARQTLYLTAPPFPPHAESLVLESRPRQTVVVKAGSDNSTTKHSSAVPEKWPSKRMFHGTV